MANFLDLKEGDFLCPQAKLKTDLHDRCVFLRVPVILDNLKEVLLLLSCEGRAPGQISP
ncbi:TPA: hypothetical protein L4F62_006497 [Pseudomonas aeruginosa]|uniref:hypothetical protein n=1 Tax=Pseudomonas aeruginosa TaxID=287 RepID=UPI0025559EE3|nr:hypothetical protein [Pseudomonas aeruginosa]HBO1619935.1 hypothetical protein [Pseudomonas aeruginosa]